MHWFISLGMICLFITGLYSGAWTTGYQQRGNFNSESEEDRPVKNKVTTWSALAGIISFAIAGLIYFLS